RRIAHPVGKQRRQELDELVGIGEGPYPVEDESHPRMSAVRRFSTSLWILILPSFVNCCRRPSSNSAFRSRALVRLISSRMLSVCDASSAMFGGVRETILPNTRAAPTYDGPNTEPTGLVKMSGRPVGLPTPSMFPVRV